MHNCLGIGKLVNLSTPLFLLDSSHKILAVNNAFCRFFNVHEEDVIGKKCYSIVHKLDSPHKKCPMRNTKAGAEFYAERFFEPSIKKYLRMELFPLNGNDIFIHTITDHTEKELLRKNLNFLHEGIKETVKKLGIAYVILDREIRLVEISEEAKQLLNIGTGMIEKTEDLAFLKCETKLCPDFVAEKVLKERCIYHDVIKVEGKSGQTCLIRRAFIPLINDKDEVEEILIVLNDIAEIERTRRLLNRTEEFLNSIIEGIGDALVVINRDFKILSANRGYLVQTGKALEEVIENYCYVVSHGYSRPCFKEGKDCPVYKTFVNGKTNKSVHEHIGKDRNLIYVEVVSYPLKDEHGNVYAAIETLRDITDLKRIEKERMELKIQLLQAQKMEAIGTLAAGIAHDFNNMLMGIAGFAEIIKKKEKNKELENYIDRILNITNKASKLTNQILIIGRKVKFKKKRLNLNRFITESLNTIKRMIEENIIITTDLSPSIPDIEADDSQLYQVLLNLIINARDVMPEGGRIIVSTYVVNRLERKKLSSRTGNFVVLSVKDNGPGIPENIKDRIFEPFFTTKEPGKGTGLGLSVVYSIVNEHGGFIDLETEVGKGTEFKIYFPAILQHTAEKKRKTDKVYAEVDGKGRGVLIAEDEEVIRDLLSICMTEWGFQVHIAKTGEEAVKLFERLSDKIEIVVLDKVMPKLSGLDALKRMKRIKKDLISIVCTGYTSSDEIDEISKAGADKVLRKPFNIEELKETLLEILE